jgi:hypothetical protein
VSERSERTDARSSERSERTDARSSERSERTYLRSNERSERTGLRSSERTNALSSAPALLAVGHGSRDPRAPGGGLGAW